MQANMETGLAITESENNDTSASQTTRIWVSRNISLHVFQSRPFTLIRVLYEFGLPVSFTRTSMFCAGRVFIQLV